MSFDEEMQKEEEKMIFSAKVRRAKQFEWSERLSIAHERSTTGSLKPVFKCCLPPTLSFADTLALHLTDRVTFL